MGLASKHNQKDWDQTPDRSAPGPTPLPGNQRCGIFDLDRNAAELAASRLPVEERRETLTLDQLGLEALFLGLRRIHLRNFAARYGWDLTAERRALLDQFQRGFDLHSGRVPHRAPCRSCLGDRLSLESVISNQWSVISEKKQTHNPKSRTGTSRLV